MNTKIVMLVGDTSPDLATQAKQLDNLATLVTPENYTNLTDGVYYISLGDFPSMSMFADALGKANTLIYSPLADEKLKKWTEFYLLYYRNRKEVLEVESLVDSKLDSMLELADHRKTDNAQLWVAGCSVTHGDGVELHERYGALLGKQLNMCTSFLSCPGSSIDWAADQILRSDLRAGDIVVWGLTSVRRFPYYDEKVNQIDISYYQQNKKFNNVIDIDRLSDTNMLYRAITRITEVTNICNKLNVKLVIAGLLIDETFIHYTVKLGNYIQLFGRFDENNSPFIDMGTDGEHPGPLTHKWYAQEIIKRIK